MITNGDGIRQRLPHCLSLSNSVLLSSFILELNSIYSYKNYSTFTPKPCQVDGRMQTKTERFENLESDQHENRIRVSKLPAKLRLYKIPLVSCSPAIRSNTLDQNFICIQQLVIRILAWSLIDEYRRLLYLYCI